MNTCRSLMRLKREEINPDLDTNHLNCLKTSTILLISQKCLDKEVNPNFKEFLKIKTFI